MWVALSLAAGLVAPTADQAFEAHGGFALIDLAVPGAPPIPVVSGDAAWHRRLAGPLWLGARYRTHLGAVHRLGAELDGVWPVGAGFALGGRLFASGSVAGAWQDGLDAGGDLATLGALAVAWSGLDGHVLRVEGGLTVEWLLWEHIGGRSAVDAAVYPAYGELAADWRWGWGEAWLGVRGEVAIPLDVDPYAPGGVYPRVSVGGGFGW